MWKIRKEFLKHQFKVSYMFLYHLGIHQNVISVDYDKVICSSQKMVFMRVVNVKCALRNLKGMTRNSKDPYLM